MAKRPGLYITFQEAAARQISGGIRGTVAIPLKTYNGTATEKTFYSITKEEDAITLFGEANIRSIKLALQGGCRTVLVWTLPVIDGTNLTEQAAYKEALQNIETRDYNTMAFDGAVSEIVHTEAKTWVMEKRTEGKHFFLIVGGDDTSDQDIALGNDRSERLNDDYIVNLVSGGTLETGEELDSSELSPYIAGVLASTPLNASVTYKELPLIDVAKRFRKAEIETALDSGSLLFFHDGEIVRIESGVTTSGKKIRAVASRQAISTDIRTTVNANYIGKLNNTVDSRTALIAMIKSYLESLEDQDVLTSITVTEDAQNPSIGDTVNLQISYVEVDSMEKINLGISI